MVSRRLGRLILIQKTVQPPPPTSSLSRRASSTPSLTTHASSR